MAGAIGCMFPGCERIQGRSSKGLCTKHHYRYSQSVLAGTTTWEELYKAGKALPPKKRVGFIFDKRG